MNPTKLSCHAGGSPPVILSQHPLKPGCCFSPLPNPPAGAGLHPTRSPGQLGALSKAGQARDLGDSSSALLARSATKEQGVVTGGWWQEGHGWAQTPRAFTGPERGGPGSLPRGQKPLKNTATLVGLQEALLTSPSPFFSGLRKGSVKSQPPSYIFMFYRVNVSTESITSENIHSSTPAVAAQGEVQHLGRAGNNSPARSRGTQGSL